MQPPRIITSLRQETGEKIAPFGVFAYLVYGLFLGTSASASAILSVKYITFLYKSLPDYSFSYPPLVFLLSLVAGGLLTNIILRCLLSFLLPVIKAITTRLSGNKVYMKTFQVGLVAGIIFGVILALSHQIK